MFIEWSAFLNLLKQYGPTVAVLLLIIYLQWRHIDKLLERNGAIYESHIKSLYETQNRLLTKLIGPQPSSQALPTMEDLKSLPKGDTNQPAKVAEGRKDIGK